MPKDFSRDLGYLDKFLQGLRAHAATLGGSAGTRLSALMDEQDRAWAEIKGILEGAPVAQSASPAASAGAMRSAAESVSSEPATAARSAEAAPRRLTVGSLMTKP